MAWRKPSEFVYTDKFFNSDCVHGSLPFLKNLGNPPVSPDLCYELDRLNKKYTEGTNFYFFDFQRPDGSHDICVKAKDGEFPSYSTMMFEGHDPNGKPLSSRQVCNNLYKMDSYGYIDYFLSQVPSFYEGFKFFHPSERIDK